MLEVPIIVELLDSIIDNTEVFKADDLIFELFLHKFLKALIFRYFVLQFLEIDWENSILQNFIFELDELFDASPYFHSCINFLSQPGAQILQFFQLVRWLKLLVIGLVEELIQNSTVYFLLIEKSFKLLLPLELRACFVLIDASVVTGQNLLHVFTGEIFNIPLELRNISELLCVFRVYDWLF